MTRGIPLALVALAAATIATGCEIRARPERPPDSADVAPVLERACIACHGPAVAEAGYRVDTYTDVTACPADTLVSAVEPAGPEAAILATQAVDPHVDLLDEAETALLTAWVEDGAPARVGGAHPAGWSDPRSDEFHGRALRHERWSRMLDPSRPDACARCHGDTATDLPDAGAGPAPGATSCTACHREAGGPFACTTCHGTPGHPEPPRDLCRHPDEIETEGAHPKHLMVGLVCTTCHGEERTVDDLRDGLHGDGIVQVTFDLAVVGAGTTWEPGERTCRNGTCHDRGGETPTPIWMRNSGFTCQSCHPSPPADHYAGTCDQCHDEAAPTGDSLVRGPLHANGRVDLGDGTGGCGACHGEGDDPAPRDPTHQAHVHSTISEPIACSECHEVPAEHFSPGHLDHSVGAEVRFGPLGTARGATPTWDRRSCAGTACHMAVTPTWGADPAVAACGTCHGLPPESPHPTGTTCGASRCHSELVGPGPALTPAGVVTHIDGRVDPWAASSSP